MGFPVAPFSPAAQPQPIDYELSTRWAIASLHSEGMILAGHTTFDLVNLRTVRAHRLDLAAAGISAKLPVSASVSMSNYTSFTTRRPVNFMGFSGKGARQTSASIIIYSIAYLRIWYGRAYFDPLLCYLKLAGWGPALPSVGFEHGVTEVIYGDGNPVDLTGFTAEPEFDVPSAPEEIDNRIQMTQQDDSLVIRFQGDALFDFDKHVIRPDAQLALRQAGAIIRSLRVRRVDIDGYTDGKGSDDYNNRLSEQRAKGVADWLASHRYAKSSILNPKGHGKLRPVAPNTKPDGSDDPIARAKNRRIEIYLIKG